MTKLYGKPGIFAFALASEDDAFAVLGVADARSFAETGAAGGRGEVHPRANCIACSALAEEGCGVVERAAADAAFASAEALRCIGFGAAARVLVS